MQTKIMLKRREFKKPFLEKTRRSRAHLLVIASNFLSLFRKRPTGSDWSLRVGLSFVGMQLCRQNGTQEGGLALK